MEKPGFEDNAEPSVNNNGAYFVSVEWLNNLKVYDVPTSEDSDAVIYEYCPFCEQEVELKNEFKVQICPNCGKHILPCSICAKEHCQDCELERVREEIIKNK